MSKPRNPGAKVAVNAGMEASRDAASDKAPETLSQTLERRDADMTAWLRENAPQVSNDQRHLDEGSVESAYWHYGYLMALRDLRRVLEGGPQN